jgi:hypothetical protein
MWASATHVVNYIPEFNFYRDIELIVANNPTIIYVRANGTIVQDTLTLVVANECGSDTLRLILTSPVLPVYEVEQPECCEDTLVYYPREEGEVSIAYARILYITDGVTTDTLDWQAFASGYEGYAQHHVANAECEGTPVKVDLNVFCNVTPPYVSVVWCGIVDDTNLKVAIEVGFAGSCGLDRRIIILGDTCNSIDCEEARKADPDSFSSQPDKIEVFPNPANSSATLKYFSHDASSYTITVTDLAGRILLLKDVISKEGLNYHELDLSTLSTGAYFIHLKSAGKYDVVKIMVE